VTVTIECGLGFPCLEVEMVPTPLLMSLLCPSIFANLIFQGGQGG
jgi:hypothetical protein